MAVTPFATTNAATDDPLVLRPELGPVQKDVCADLGHGAGLDQLTLDWLGVVVEQFVAVEYGLAIFEKPHFQWQKI